MELSVVSLPDNSLAGTNCVYVSGDTIKRLYSATPRGVTSSDEVKAVGLKVWVNSKYVFSARPHKHVEEGCLAVGSIQRECVGLPLDRPCQLKPYVPPKGGRLIASATFEVQRVLTRSQSSSDRVVDCEVLKKEFQETFAKQVFGIGQLLIVYCDNVPLRLQCQSLDSVDLEGSKVEDQDNSFRTTVGQIHPDAILAFTKGKDAPVRLTNQSSGQAKTVFKPDFDFSKLGIGGLDKEFNDIFRRAFASRLFPSDVIAKLGIQHVRGMLLFGPPGCGKTLIARKISQALTAKEPKIVNGPEILDKFVGESERKIRELFADARQEQEEMGDDSEVHIIIFDEIDAICKSRGSSRDGTGVGDSVVNQLLTQIDGVDSLNNVLVIGMTNRKDMLDEALMRPGRLEVQIEINLPDAKGRAQILHIHTNRMREKKALHRSVIQDLESFEDPSKAPSDDPDYRNLVQRTKNFSGAEIEGLVRAATAHALSRGTDGQKFTAASNFDPVVRMEDFNLALEEVKPKFGAPSDELSLHYRNGIVPYGPNFDNVYSSIMRVVKHVQANDRTSVMSVLLHGDRGSGKTALAAYSAVASEFPLVRMIKASDLIARSDSAKSSHIYNVFEEAYRSPLSLIILDDMERLMDYVGMGPRFSNPVLQALLVLVKNPVPVKGRKLVVMGVTSNIDAMRALELADSFDMSVEVPLLSSPEELTAVLDHVKLPTSREEKSRIVDLLGTRPVPVKKLLTISEMVKEELASTGTKEVSADMFVDCANRFDL